MNEKKSFNFGLKDGALEFGLDPNKDGQNVLKGKLVLSEAIQEAFSRGAPVEGVKSVEFKFEMSRLVVKIDTDKDGESVFELELDLAEAIDEVQGLLSKKDDTTKP